MKKKQTCIIKLELYWVSNKTAFTNTLNPQSINKPLPSLSSSYSHISPFVYSFTLFTVVLWVHCCILFAFWSVYMCLIFTLIHWLLLSAFYIGSCLFSYFATTFHFVLFVSSRFWSYITVKSLVIWCWVRKAKYNLSVVKCSQWTTRWVCWFLSVFTNGLMINLESSIWTLLLNKLHYEHLACHSVIIRDVIR